MAMKTAIITIVSIFLLIFMPMSLRGTTESSDPNSYFYPADSEPFGKSYPEWAADWWKFVLEYPVKDARLTDSDGSLCAVNQTGNVWILPGAESGEIIRNCVVPQGVALLVSPTDSFCNKQQQPSVGDNEQEIRKCVKADIDEDEYSHTYLDGVQLSNLHDVNRLQSVVFDLYYPPNEGPYKTVADGVFLMLKPLSPGNHTLIQEAGAPSQNWNYKVTYNLQIK